MTFFLNNSTGPFLLFLSILCIEGCAITPSSGFYGWSVAANAGANEKAKLLIQKGEGLNSKDVRRDSPLLWAARNKDAELVRLLIDRKVDLNQSNEITGETALILASKNGDTDLFDLLIMHGAELSIRDSFGSTALDWAIQENKIDIVRKILASTKTKIDFNNNSSLISAVYSNQPSMVALLLQNGALINSRDSQGDTPLIAAAKTGNAAIFDLVMENGADKNLLDASGRSPFVLACQAGHILLVNAFIQAGTDVNSSSTHSLTPLMFAAANGQAAVVDLLLSNHANPDVVNSENKTAIYLAAENGHWYIVKMLLSQGSDIYLIDDETQSASPKVSAALYKFSGDYYLIENDIENAVKTYNLAARLFSSTADMYAEKSSSAYVEEVVTAIGKILLVAAVSVGQQIDAQNQAKQNAQIMSLKSSRTVNGYYSNVNSLTPIYQRAAMIESNQKNQKLQEWYLNQTRNPKGNENFSDYYNELSEKAKGESELITKTLACINDTKTGRISACMNSN